MAFSREEIGPGSAGERALLLEVRAQAQRLGLDRVAIASLQPPPDAAEFDAWIARGEHAGMTYLTRHRDLRSQPARFFPGARSIVCVAWNYYRDPPGARRSPDAAHAAAADDGAPRIARFAHGLDYHDVLRGRLRELLARLRTLVPDLRGRVAVDSAPVAERTWAARAGLGWIGRNRCLIVPGLGSWVLLGEILLDVPLPGGSALPGGCGECRRCLDACPGRALRDGLPLDARRCIAYWTIEHRGAFGATALPPLAPWVFGCDACQEVCPWNAAPTPCAEPRAAGMDDAMRWRLADWERLGADAFAWRFGETALARTGYEGILRNARRVAWERGGHD
jgi:epoxyqueuosine reductase